MMSWSGEDDLKDMRANEHYKGWWPLLDRVAEFIAEQRKDGPVEILQVKEKFGGLRVYANGLSQEADKELWALVDESYKLCQICGQPGSIKGSSGWIVTLCPHHRKEYNEGKGAFKR